MATDKRDRYLGSMLGLACGDAVGTTLEFKAPGTFPPITDMVGGGPFHLQAGQWTDDTSMALCLADSLIACQGFDAADQMRRYLRWRDEGHLSSTGRCFDIGNTVDTALTAFRRTGEAFSGSTAARGAGNGCIMRLAPVPLFFADDPAQAIHFSGESSRTTHGARSCIDACRYLGAVLAALAQGRDKEAALAAGAALGTSLCPEIAGIAEGSFKRKQPPAIRGTGYVVDALEAALWAFHHSDNFRDGCLLAANLGDDADTTAAIYGQIAGACHGVSNIPAHWLAQLSARELIQDYALRLLR